MQTTTRTELPTQSLEEYVDSVRKQAEAAGVKRRKAPKAKQGFKEFMHHCGYRVRVFDDGRVEYPDGQ